MTDKTTPRYVPQPHEKEWLREWAMAHGASLDEANKIMNELSGNKDAPDAQP